MASGSNTMRFISPDGLPLAQLLDNRDSQGNNQPSRSGRKSRKGKVDQRWSRSTTTSSWLPGAHSEADAIELNAISKVGRERRRRWLNDKILRDMAGALTAPDMESLFQPPPFGGPVPAARPTVLQAAALPENLPLWDLFRSIDMEKQQRVLLKWEEHVAAKSGRQSDGENIRDGDSGNLLGSSSETACAPLVALRAWSKTGRKARDALRRAPLDVVHGLEQRIVQELMLPPVSQQQHRHDQAAPSTAQGEAQDQQMSDGSAALSPSPVSLPQLPPLRPPQGSSTATAATAAAAAAAADSVSGSRRELQLSLPDGFHRLLVHGIATYHGLVSSSHDVVEGSDRCSSLLQGSSLTAAAAVDAASAATETAKAASSFSPSKSSVVEQITRSSTHAFAGSEAAASVAAGPAAAAAPGGISDLRHSQPSPSQYQGAHSLGRVTVVRQRQQGEERQLAHDAIMVADIVLVMDQREEGNLTAAMLEVPGTPASESYGPQCAAHVTHP